MLEHVAPKVVTGNKQRIRRHGKSLFILSVRSHGYALTEEHLSLFISGQGFGGFDQSISPPSVPVSDDLVSPGAEGTWVALSY
jgi:hypothetical protein